MTHILLGGHASLALPYQMPVYTNKTLEPSILWRNDVHTRHSSRMWMEQYQWLVMDWYYTSRLPQCKLSSSCLCYDCSLLHFFLLEKSCEIQVPKACSLHKITRVMPVLYCMDVKAGMHLTESLTLHYYTWATSHFDSSVYSYSHTQKHQLILIPCSTPYCS